jgi:ribosomal-protein-alanine N-acetyltransferase
MPPFLAAVKAGGLHRGGSAAFPRSLPIRPPLRDCFGRDNLGHERGFVVCRHDDDAIVGVFNIGEIVRGLFRARTLATMRSPARRRDYATEASKLVLRVAFRSSAASGRSQCAARQRRSLALIRRAVFVRGLSRRYVKSGNWRDHVRLASLPRIPRPATKRVHDPLPRLRRG